MMHVHHKMMQMHQGMMRLHQILPLVAMLAAGCSADSGFHCRDDADCGGSACVNGMCRMLASQPDLTSGAPPDGSLPDLTSPSMTPVDGGLALDALAASCSFNSDGVIQRSEAPFLIGL